MKKNKVNEVYLTCHFFPEDNSIPMAWMRKTRLGQVK
jgi:hypothetical protein